MVGPGVGWAVEIEIEVGWMEGGAKGLPDGKA